MNTLSVLTILSLIISCTSINTDSKQYYEGKKMRHGIVPLENAPKSGPKRVLSDRSVALGKKVYDENCMSCHGVDGSNVENVNLATISQSIPNFKFYLLVSQNKNKMPGWKNILSESEVEQLESYLYSFSR